MKGRNVIVVLIALALGAFVGAWYQIAQQTYKSEEVIAKEVALLEQHKNTPSCKSITEAQSDWGTIPIKDGIIVWQYDIDQQTLQKVVVDKALTAAFEETVLDCLK